MAAGPLARTDRGALARATVRTVPWAQMLAAGGLALGFVLLATGRGVALDASVDRLRLAAVLVAIGVAGVLDDPTRPHLDTAPVGLAHRQALRLGVGAVVSSTWWALVVLAVAYHPATWSDGPRGASVPVVAITVVLVGLVAATWAVAAVATRRSSRAGVLPAAVAVTLPVVPVVWPPLREAMWPPLPAAGDAAALQAWMAAHQRWAVIAVVAITVIAWALRDPCRPSPIRTGTRRRSHQAAAVRPTERTSR